MISIRSNKIHLLLVLGLGLSLLGCTPSGSGRSTAGRIPGEPISIIVSVEPQCGLVEQIGGDQVAVSVLVPAGKEPETFQPTPDALTRMAKAQLYFRIGFTFENTLLPKVRTIAPDLNVVDFRDGIKMRPLELHSHAHCDCGHDHGHDHAHDGESCADAEGRDVHTWMSTINLVIQAETVCKALCTLDPDNAATYRDNADAWIARCKAVHADTAEKLAPYRDEVLYVFHPAYGYFCDEFNLAQRAIEFEGRSPRPKEITAWTQSLAASSEKANVKPTIFVQPQFNRSAADTIAAASGARIVVHSPLENDPLRAIESFAELFLASRRD